MAIDSNPDIKTKAGYVAIIGKPNAGKSTLLNNLIGFKLSIVTAKPQTTRKRVLGILSEDNNQIVFIDTPGVVNPRYQMQKQMMKYVDMSGEEADVLVFMLDLSKFNINQSTSSYFGEKIETLIKESKKPKILILNKIDTYKEIKNLLPLISRISKEYTFNEIIPISALKTDNLKNLTDSIFKFLPEGPFFYDPEMLSTQPQKFFASEIIREVIFNKFSEEIPYSTEVHISEFKERKTGKWYISADIIVEKDNQKMIMIGAGGEKLKSVGETARKNIEEHLELEIYLELFVKVRENWRQNQNLLSSYGY